MNVDTGEIIHYTATEAALARAQGQRIVPVSRKDLTPKQASEMRVNLHDSRSKLGRKRIAERRRLQKKRRASERRRKAAWLDQTRAQRLADEASFNLHPLQGVVVS